MKNNFMRTIALCFAVLAIAGVMVACTTVDDTPTVNTTTEQVPVVQPVVPEPTSQPIVNVTPPTPVVPVVNTTMNATLVFERNATQGTNTSWYAVPSTTPLTKTFDHPFGYVPPQGNSTKVVLNTTSLNAQNTTA